MKSRFQNAVLWFWALGSVALFFYWCLASSATSSQIIISTLALGLASAAMSLSLGVILLRAIIARENKTSLIMMVVVSAVLPVYLQVGAWDSIFGKLGWLTGFFTDSFAPILTRWIAAIWIHGLAATPQVTLILLAGWSVGRGQFEEQGLLDASATTVFWRVTLRRLLPFAGLATVWVLVSCSREIAVTDIYQIGTLAEYIYLGYALEQGGQIFAPWTNEAQELGLFVQIVTLAWIGLGTIWFVGRILQNEIEVGPWSSPRSEGPRSRVHRSTGWVLMGIIFLVPLINLVVRGSTTVIREGDATRREIQFSSFLTALRRAIRDYPDEAFWSLVMGLTGSVCVIILSVLMAHAARTNRVIRIMLVTSIVLSLALPGPLIGNLISRVGQLSNASWYVCFFDRTIFAPTLASSLFVWPVVAILATQVMRTTSRNLLQQSTMDGAGWWKQLTSIVLSQHRYVFLGLWGITWVLIVGELSAAQMVQVAGMDTLPRLTLGLLHSGVDEKTAAVTFLTIVVISVASAVSWALIKKLGNEKHYSL